MRPVFTWFTLVLIFFYKHQFVPCSSIESYSGPSRIANKIASMYKPDETSVLDFGCGTGLVADYLFEHGFRNVDGYDCNKDLLDVAREKVEF